MVGAVLCLGAHCECPDEAVVPASYEVVAGQLSIDGVDALSFDDCAVRPESGPYFSTDEVPTTLDIECGVPVLEPTPGEPLFRLSLALGDLREGVDRTIDLSTLNLIAEWSDDGVPVGPSAVPEGGTAVLRTSKRSGSRAPYPENVTDDFALDFTVEITLPPFVGRGGDSFPGGSMQLAIAQRAKDYRRDPGPDPDCL